MTFQEDGTNTRALKRGVAYYMGYLYNNLYKEGTKWSIWVWIIYQLPNRLGGQAYNALNSHITLNRPDVHYIWQNRPKI